MNSLCRQDRCRWGSTGHGNSCPGVPDAADERSFSRHCVWGWISLWGICLLSSVGTLQADETRTAVTAKPTPGRVVLVEQGKNPAPIVLATEAPPAIQQAAEELAQAIETISGARPKIVQGTPDPLPESAIWVGYQPVLEQLFPDVDFRFTRPEEILLKSDARHVAILGRDKWDPEHLVVEGINEKITGKQQEYGTANAVYTFMQKSLGVRWFWPGELGADFPRQATLALEPVELRYAPQIRARGGAFTFSRLSNRGYGRAHEWSRRQRLQLDSLEIGGGHAFSHWWEAHHQTQPELFALQPDGTRSGFPNPRTVKICESSPVVWQQWLRDVEEQLRKDPTRTIFSGSPNDGWMTGHCVCENCAQWDHPEGEPRKFNWHQHAELRPALSDRHVTFANHLARALKQRYPDKDYYVSMLSYGHSRPAPVTARPDDNVIMVSVANFYGRTELVDRGSTYGATYRQQFADWGQIVPGLVWRPNTGSPAGWQHGLPDLSVQQTAEDLKFAVENRCVGIYIDSVWEHWATQGPQYYLMAHHVWDPRSDPEAILQDYYQRAFGPAAQEVRAYYELLEQARMDFVQRYEYAASVVLFPELYTPELLEKAFGHLDRAAQAIPGEEETLVKRVAFVRAGLEYTQLLMETIGVMTTHWGAPADQREQTDRQARELWARMQQIPVEHPYAINPGPVRPNTPRMVGLHPDYPHPKWKTLFRVQPKTAPANDLDQD